MRKIILFIIAYFFLLINKVFANDIEKFFSSFGSRQNTGSSQGVIVPGVDTIIKEGGDRTDGTEVIDSVVNKLIDYAFIILPAVAIGAFVYAGYLLITSSGDDGKLKKAWNIFAYTLIGVTVAYLSYLAVRLVLNVSI